MANENKDVIRHEDTAANLLASTRPGQLGFETDGNHRMIRPELATGSGYHFTPDEKFDSHIPAYSNAINPALTNVWEGLDFAIAGGFSGYSGTSGYSGRIGDRYATSSSNSMPIGTCNNEHFFVDPDLAYTVGQEVLIAYDDNNKMAGDVLSYDKLTGEMYVDVTSFNGSGTYSTWAVN